MKSSKLNVEKVVYAPKNPVPIKRLTERETPWFPNRSPIRKEPVMLTRNVPSGNNLDHEK